MALNNTSLSFGTAVILALSACSPTVKLETPKPIEINLNVKIQQEVRVKVDKDIDAAIADDPALFGTSKKGR